MACTVAKRSCMYCGQATGRGKRGEHIVPAALGGALTLNDGSGRVVCQKCNSGVLGRLDKELCSRSFLSVVASRVINTHLWQAWDVDHDARNLLVEAKPVWKADGEMDGLACYPQITFEQRGPDIRGNPEEFRQFGAEDFPKVLFSAVRYCFGRHRSGERGALHFEKVRSGVIQSGYRFAPRIYTPRAINEIAANIRRQSFVLRFTSEEDKEFVLATLPGLGDGSQFKKFEVKKGSHAPTISFFFDIEETMRALFKMGVNLIAAHCPNTPVAPDTFGDAIRIVRGEAGQPPPPVFRANGFVPPAVVESIRADGNAHSFRLVHVDGRWHVYSNFFGGQIGAHVCVPGPNREDWCVADIIAPLGSKAWEVRTRRILPVMKAVRVEWMDGSVVVPSLKLQSRMSSLSVETVKKKRPNGVSGND